MKNKTVRALSLDAMFLALLIVSSFISFPIGYLKISLQLLTVFLIAIFLSLKDGLLIITCYIAMGLLGIPVFASFGGGIAYALSPTFGFVYGFYFVILIYHLFKNVLLKKIKNGVVANSIAILVSLLVLYVVGFIHGYLILLLVINKSDLTFAGALNIFIIPYIPFDIGKGVIAIGLSSKYMNLLIPLRERHYEEIDSTNTYLKNNYKYYPSFTFVDASYQSQGRGRKDRIWESNKDESLLFSILIKDKNLLQNAPILSLYSAYCVYLYLTNTLNLSGVSIKWPNDVYVNGKKICGILLEGISEKEKTTALVIGVGLNVKQETFPEGLRITPTSLKKELGKDMPIKDIKKGLYDTFKTELKNFDINKALKVINENNYLKEKKCFYEGKEIIVSDIDKDGSLNVIIEGERKNIISGEIEFRD